VLQYLPSGKIKLAFPCAGFFLVCSERLFVAVLAGLMFIFLFVCIVLVIFLSSFVVFGNWTEQGIKKVTDAPKRIKDTRGMIEKAGGKMQLFYTAGKWDFVMIVEIPKDEDLMAILLCIGSMGNIRTTTMKAWTETQGAKILTTPHP
jgi:uncharacterized protein with GYD domain